MTVIDSRIGSDLVWTSQFSLELYNLVFSTYVLFILFCLNWPFLTALCVCVLLTWISVCHREWRVGMGEAEWGASINLQPVAFCWLISHHLAWAALMGDKSLWRSKASVAVPNQSACKWGGKHLFWVQVYTAAHGRLSWPVSPLPSSSFSHSNMMADSHSCTLLFSLNSLLMLKI